MMNTPQSRGRRTLDGFARRPSSFTLPQLSATNTSASVATPTEEIEVTHSDGYPADDTPVLFEYHKKQRDRPRLPPKLQKFAKFAAFGLLIVGIGVGSWVAYRTFMAARNIISQSHGGAPALNGIINLSQLKGEGDGRVNILVLGIGGEGHEGPNLSDTILVMSIDPKTKDAAMLSIPRDMYVKLAAVGNYGTQYGKINAANVYGGPQYASKIISGVIGVPLHYYVVVDFSGFRQAIDAVGGVDIDVPTAIYDPSYPCDNERGGYCAFSIKAGKQHLSGTVALRYARSRHTTSDFDRAARQQLVIAALREKALQLSTLTNPLKLTALIDALGSHVQTDLQPGEISKLASLVKDIDMTKVVQKVLDTESEDALLVGGTNIIAGAGYIEVPRVGNYNYSEIQDFVKNIFIDHYITDENAVLEVQNGSGTSGVATAVVKSLKAAHYNVLQPANAEGQFTTTLIYDYTGGKKPYTINYLEQRFGVKAQKAAAPVPVTTGTDPEMTVPEIRIILGSDYKTASSTN